MEEIVTILSTREWAIAIWGTGFFVWMLTQRKIRKSLWNVIKILLGKNLRHFFLIIALYVAGITMIFYQLPFWNNIYLKDIVDKEFYNYDAKEHEMKKYLLDYIEDNNLNEFSSFDGLIENLRLCALIHKHPSFSAEQEVRISPLLINEEDEHIEYKVLNIIKRVYIAKIDELCQSTKVEFSDLIEKLVVGPKSVQNLKDLKWYLKKIGLPELKDKVEKSECPLR